MRNGMSPDSRSGPPLDAGFAALVNIHRHLLLNPEPAAGIDAQRARMMRGEITTRGDPPSPTRLGYWCVFEQTHYTATDAAALNLHGHATFDDINEPSLDAAIRHVIAVEGPIHRNVLVYRLLGASGFARAGARIQARIEERLETLAQADTPTAAAGFNVPQAQTPGLADPAWLMPPEPSVTSPSRPSIEIRGPFAGYAPQWQIPAIRDWRDRPDRERRLDHIPPTELELGLLRIVLEREREQADRAMNDAIHRIGFPRFTDQARTIIQPRLLHLIDVGALLPVSPNDARTPIVRHTIAETRDSFAAVVVTPGRDVYAQPPL
ncbi:MAG: DUF3320 domain-containing protein [Thioalkalivibrionaceae bacterium]